MSIVLLIDADRDTVGSVSDLRYGVHDASVVLISVTGGNYIQSVADVEQSRKVVFISSIVLLSKILLSQLSAESVDLLDVLIVHRRLDMDMMIGVCDMLAALEHLTHGLFSQRRP